ncbi:ankyrin [Coprinopsis marcescibilis]|uniref:Ankyrin n=1 Tax=Coprinopsis marcescibilis TaxID=230819 RepID=A0A5C3L9E9_COPMA|nr:ankyrin [Coprinopsis marcescibilis]
MTGRDSIVNIYNTFADNPSREKEVTIISRWLTNINYQIMQNTAFGKRAPSTGTWILEKGEVLVWLATKGRIVWGTGMPGAGKTILSSIVINHLQSLAKSRGNISVVFAYFRYTNPITVKDVLAALVRQNLEDHPAVYEFVKPLYDHHLRKGTHPSQEELFNLLKQIARSNIFTMSFCVLDGLDEAPSDTQTDILSSLSSLGINFFITSRPLAALNHIVPEASFINITVKNADIALMLADRVNRSPAFKGLLNRDDWHSKVLTKVLEKSSGMFLLASLQVDMLRECLTIKDLRDCLERLPTGVNDMYVEAMRRIDMQSAGKVVAAKRALIWVLYACEPLSMGQLVSAVAICPQTHRYDEECVIDSDILIGLCCGLISAESLPGRPSRMGARLVHYTTADFLKEAFPDSVASVAIACVMQLKHHGIGRRKLHSSNLSPLFAKDSLLAYCYANWASHARKCKSMPPAVIEFVQECRHYPLNKKGLYLNPLQVAAMFDFPEILHQLLSQTPQRYDPSTAGEGGMAALMYAAARGCTDSMYVFLNWNGGGLLCTRDENGKTALICAALAGHAAIVEMLLNLLPQTDGTVSDYSTALLGAIGGGHQRVVEVFIKSGMVEVLATAPKADAILLKASTYGSYRVVNALLRARSELITARDENGQTSLTLASRYGYRDVVRCLLGVEGVELNAVNAFGMTALMYSVLSYRKDIFKLLIGLGGIDVNAHDARGWTTLMYACHSGDQSVVGSVLEVKADVNAVDVSGRTALFYWAVWGKSVIVKRLLRVKGVDVNRADKNGKTPLIVALERKHEDASSALLPARDLDINVSEPGSGQTALILASSWGKEGLVNAILGFSAIDVNAVDKDRRTALFHACMAGHDGVARILSRAKGIDLGAMDSAGCTPLMCASSRGYSNITEILLGDTSNVTG